MTRSVRKVAGVTLATVAVLLCLSTVNAYADTYVGTMPGIWSVHGDMQSAGWLGNDPDYNLVSSNRTPAPVQVYEIRAGVYGFYDPTQGWMYDGSNTPCGLWWCADAGIRLTGDGAYIVHCYPGEPGWFSLWSAYNGLWGTSVQLPNGYWGVYFGDGTDPIYGSFPNPGLFNSHLTNMPGAWCGA